MRRSASVLILAAALACSSSPAPTTVAIASPTEAERIYGSRSITVHGTVTGDGVTSVSVKLNGGAPVSAPVSNGTYHAVVTLVDKANTIEVDVTGKSGSAVAGPVHVLYPFLALNTFQNASLVLGQADFTTGADNRGGSAAVNTISQPYGDPAWDGMHLFVGDYGNNRVLVWNSFPATNGQAADWVIGQPNFTTTTGGASATVTNGPETIRVADGKLFVQDYGNNRVLLYNSIPTATGAPASVAVGQPDLVTAARGCTATMLSTNESVLVVGTKLVVMDSNNNRVLIWNSIPTASGTAADLVLGQKDFTHCAVGAPSAETMNYPTDAWSDGTRLFITDQLNNRVLIWNAFPATSQAPADLVLGQPDFATTTPGATATTMDSPYYLASNGNQLFVSDSNNNRVLIWNSMPTTSGAAPDRVLGQGDFTHNSANDDAQAGKDGAAPTARTLWNPTGVTVTDDALLVGDVNNNRLTVYR